jgi:hypothetical protein
MELRNPAWLPSRGIFLAAPASVNPATWNRHP